MVLKDDQERATIADLEAYGLSLRWRLAASVAQEIRLALVELSDCGRLCGIFSHIVRSSRSSNVRFRESSVKWQKGQSWTRSS